MTANISIPDHPDNPWCPVCLESWLPDMVPVRIRVRWHHEVICGKPFSYNDLPDHDW